MLVTNSENSQISIRHPVANNAIVCAVGRELDGSARLGRIMSARNNRLMVNKKTWPDAS